MILNEEYLRKYARTEMRSSITENVNSLKHFSESNTYDIFISHSSLDEELTFSLYDLFIQNGFTAYLDYEDTELNPQNVTKKTGEKLRSKLKHCKTLAYVATSNIANSKWCPWELGLYDGLSNGKCCILPIVKERISTFHGQEYLGLYPYLTYEKYSNSNEWTFWINDPDNNKKYASFKEWLKNKELKMHE